MIDQHTDYAGWATLVQEIDDAAKHLRDLVREMNAAGALDEEAFRVGLGHVYAHLNRAWHLRHGGRDAPTPEQHAAWSRFPDDVPPVG